ncbi:hypothetical protein [Mycolicibacterium fallax]|uniref:Uncharacterized protein n=1 Tax=Mycolicibacterium fallax TaxID=1793 RepID=A0A1X1R2N5_MYCFA|nr:hypothetical protein [Mycolicibacterium fallax]ORU98514.1 hypothetical protein AWC04_18085 [Mycolicibacterium fallax]BBZ00373.1 hypothetical protein MFAL_38390 [Mycolicibacterium fallax]
MADNHDEKDEIVDDLDVGAEEGGGIGEGESSSRTSRHARKGENETEVKLSKGSDSQDEVEDDGEAEPEPEPEPELEPEDRPAAAPRGKAAIWLAALALVVALGALAAALWPMFQTEDEDVEVAVVYTDEEVGAAKANTCRAFEMARMAIAVRSGANPGENPEPALAEVVAANARSAFAATGPYLLNNIGVATPDALAEAVTNFADQADEVGLAALAGLGTDDPALAGPLGQVTELEAKISEMCK